MRWGLRPLTPHERGAKCCARMPSFFNPVDHPILLSVPSRAGPPHEGFEHAPFAMLLVDWLRIAHAAGVGLRTRALLHAVAHAGAALGAGTRTTELPAGAPPSTVKPRSLGMLILDARDADGREDLVGAWLPALAEGGVILITGTNAEPGDRDEVPQPCAAWRLLAARHPHFHFTHGGGMGVLSPAAAPGRQLQALLGAEADEAQRLRAYFAAAGAQLAQVTAAVQEAAQLEVSLKEKSLRVAELTSQVDRQRHELQLINDSLLFRAVKTYWAARETVLPPQSRGGDLYRTAKGRLSSVVGRARSLLPQGRSESQVSQSLPVLADSDAPWSKPLTEVTQGRLGERVLIVAELSIPQCRRYRVQQKVEMFRQLGRETTVVSWTDQNAARSALQLAQVAIFYRVPAVPGVEALIAEARRLGIPSFYDIDDLVFDVEEYARNSNLQQLPEKERENLLEGARLYRRALSLCDHAIASTPTLAERMRAANRGTVHVVENALDAGVLSVAEELQTRPPIAHPATVTIGYGSGTRTHDADFAVASDALLEVLAAFPEVRLVIHGYLELPQAFERFRERVIRIPFLDAQDYLRAVASWDISLAPLERTVFNDAKSNIKYLEASVFGVPSVCSPCAAFRQVIVDGQNGFLADTKEEWVRALSQLVADVGARRAMGAEARRTVLAGYGPDVVAERQLRPVLEHAQPPRASGGALKVVQTNVFFAPLSFGGATIVAEEVARGLSERGCEVTVVTGALNTALPDTAVARYETHGMPVVAVQLPRGGGRALEHQNPEMARIFADVLSATRPDVVHFHSIQLLSASLADACVAAGVPYVITLHDAWWLCEKQFMVRDDGNYCFQRGIDLKVCATCVPDPSFTFRRSHELRKVLDGAALLLAPSEFQRQLYLDNGLDPAKVLVNKNGILLPEAAPPPRKVGPSLRFAYLGGRAHHKGYFWLKEIFEGLTESNFVLSLVDVQRKLGVSLMEGDDWKVQGRVEIVEPYSQDELDAFFAGVDVLLVPSKAKESFGLTVREALARNVWVISTDSGGATEDIIEGRNGNVVPIGHTEAYRSAIRALLREPSRLQGYANPFRDGLRSFAQQAEELKELLTAVAHGSGSERSEQVREAPALEAASNVRRLSAG